MVFANIKKLAIFKIDVVKKALNLSVNVFSTKVLIAYWVHNLFTSPTGDGTPILHGHPSRAKV